MMKPSNKSILSWLVPALGALAIIALSWWRLVVQNGDYLYEAQENSFWMADVSHDEPGGWFSWAGRYLTQFFYHPALGASLLIGLWLVIYGQWLYALRLGWQWCWVALALPLTLLWSVTSLGYAIYVSKVPDWYFTPTLYVAFMGLFLVVGRWFSLRFRLVWCAVVLIALGVGAERFMANAEIPAPGRSLFHGALADKNFHAELRMTRAADAGDWNAVLSEMRHAQRPTRAMWLLKNAALLNQGRLAEDWLDYPMMTVMPAFNDSVVVPMVESCGPLLYFLYGNIQFAYRWNMENMVEYGPTVRRLRHMTRCAIVKGEWDLAEKYIALLERTTFWSGWAREQRRFLHQPQAVADDPYYRIPLAISQTPENILDGDMGHLEPYLSNSLPHMKFHKCAPLAELSIVFTMQTQVIRDFWNQLYIYATLRAEAGDTSMPRTVQEAALLYLKLEPQSAPQSDFPFDKEVVQSYQRFQQRSQQLMAQGFSDEALANALKREFGHTFFWFYYFCRNLKTY